MMTRYASWRTRTGCACCARPGKDREGLIPLATRPTPYDSLQPFDAESGDLNVIIETPKGSRNKWESEPKLGVFMLAGVLPAGAVSPYNFGFVPATLGGDGDPMDVL